MNDEELSGTLRTLAGAAPQWPDVPAAAIRVGRQRRRRRRGVAAAVAAAVVAGVAVVATHGIGSDTQARPVGPVPGPGISVSDTAMVYLHAATTGDCAMTKALTYHWENTTFAWCHDPKMLSYKDVQAPMFVPASEAGANVEEVNFTMNTTAFPDHSGLPQVWLTLGVDGSQAASAAA